MLHKRIQNIRELAHRTAISICSSTTYRHCSSPTPSVTAAPPLSSALLPSALLPCVIRRRGEGGGEHVRSKPTSSPKKIFRSYSKKLADVDKFLLNCASSPQSVGGYSVQYYKKYIQEERRQRGRAINASTHPASTQGPPPSPGAAIMIKNRSDSSPSTASSPEPQQHETPPESGESSDYGFAGSWPSIPLPSSPGDVAARVMAAAETPGTAKSLTAEEDRMRGHGASGVCEGGERDCVRSMEDIASLRRGVADDKGGGTGGTRCLPSTERGQNFHYRQINTGDNSAATTTDQSSEEVASAAYERDGREDSDASMSSSASCPVTLAGSRNFGDSVGFNPAVGFGEYSRERRTSRPREQVSLPEDIYGAARVSEYWHGMHALSSLASAYVYDDIWAGDGGLNPR